MISLTFEVVGNKNVIGESQTESSIEKEQKIQREHLAEIIEDIESFSSKDKWSSDLLFRVNLIVEEMVLNILDYGYCDPSGPVQIVVTSKPETVTIDITDQAPPFDPLNDAPAPDLDSAVEDRRIGGLGVYLTRSLMDEITYNYESGENRLCAATARVKEKVTSETSSSTAGKD